MQINVYMKNGLKIEMGYPRIQSVLRKDEDPNEEMIEAFNRDAGDLERMEDRINFAHFITLDNGKREVTIRMREIALYEVIR